MLTWVVIICTFHPMDSQRGPFALCLCAVGAGEALAYISEMSVECWTGSHLTEVLTVGIPSLIIWVFGFPLLALMLLLRHRKSLALVRTQIQLGFLYSGYEGRCFYWEVVIILRKVVAIVVVVSLSTSELLIQALSILFILLLFFFAQLKIKPFYSHSMNWLECKSIFVSIITI